MTLVLDTPAPAAPTKTVADVLLHAARLIEEHGWWNGEMTKQALTGHCALTAIDDAGGDWRIANQGWDALTAHLGLRDHDDIPDWNDRQPNGAAVTAALRAAAQAAR